MWVFAAAHAYINDRRTLAQLTAAGNRKLNNPNKEEHELVGAISESQHTCQFRDISRYFVVSLQMSPLWGNLVPWLLNVSTQMPSLWDSKGQGYLVFGFNFGFRLQMLTFFRNIASTARSYRGKNTHIYKVNMYN